MNNIHEEISRCIIKLLMKEPFFAHLLSGVVRTISDKIPTAAVGMRGGNVNLYINQQFFLNDLATMSNRVAVIKHETLHLMFKHLFRMDIQKYDLRLFNFAADLVVNQFIGSWDLPKSAITLNTFPDMSLEPDQTLEWYYKKLADLRDEMKNFPKNTKVDQGDGQPESDWSQISSPQSASALEKIYGKSSHSDHSFWGKVEGEGSAAQVKSIESELDRMIVQARDRTPINNRGTIPGKINQMIDAIINKRKPQMDWRRALRIFSTNSRRTRVVHTMKRISKRYGTRPGIKIKRFQKLAIAIDTSGSVSDEYLSLFFSEIHGMWRQGAEVEIIECDAAVQRHYPYKGKFPKFVKGRGGTVFDPVFQFLKENRRMQFDGCIYFTDGYASEPTIKPPCKLFWLITPDGNISDHLKYGRAIKLQ